MKFTANEIVEMALQTEDMGYEFYIQMVNKFDDENMKSIFTKLANEELVHKQIFKEKLKFTKDTSIPDWFNFEEYQSYFKAFAENRVFPDKDGFQTFLDNIESPLEAVNIAIGFEKDTISFFHELWHMVHEDD